MGNCITILHDAQTLPIENLPSLDTAVKRLTRGNITIYGQKYHD